MTDGTHQYLVLTIITVWEQSTAAMAATSKRSTRNSIELVALLSFSKS